MNIKGRVNTGLKQAARGMGYDVRKLGVGSGNLLYETVSPIATYAPWNKDRAFMETYNRVETETLVDIYRCFELWALVKQTEKLNGAIIEVGVWRGGSGALIAKQAKLCGIAEPVYLCDTFAGVAKASSYDSHYKGGEHSDTSLSLVASLMKNLGLDNVRILQGIFPDDSAHEVEETRFRFCHIDVDVYQSAKDIVDWIWDRMPIGGIIVYDDYGFYGCDGISRFVEEQMSLPDRVVLHNLNGHAVTVKIR